MKNNSDVKVMLKEAGILFAITLIAGLILGFVYELTKEPIRKQQELAVQRACAEVFEDAAQFELIQYVPREETIASLAANGVEVGVIYHALGADGTVLGFVLETTTHQGYGGDIVIYMGVRLDGTINGISLLEISETPGLGMKAEDILVPQFAGVQAAEFTYSKVEDGADNVIDAISGATITTKAVTYAVNGGLTVVAELTEGGVANE